MYEVKKNLTLAADLDGTFLGGDRRDKNELYKIFSSAEHPPTLIFVTGRGLENVYPLLRDPVIPRPDYIIADVGATVVDGEYLEPIQPLQREIQKKWPGTAVVLEALENTPSLERQDVPQERRCSFYTKKENLSQEIYQAAEKLNCDVLYSADRYLDFLPKGVSKGSTLMELIQLENIDPRSVVVAGDTLNDLSLFETTFDGIAVGNSEEDLVNSVKNKTHVFIANKEGTGGILEGLTQRGIVAPKEGVVQTVKKSEKVNAGDSDQLVIVYHRLPFEEAKKGGKYIKKRLKSPNGIVPTLLRLFSKGREGVWVASSASNKRQANEELAALQPDADDYPNLKLSRVWLDKEDIEIFYQRFSKEAFWPLLHSFPDKTAFIKAHWDRFVEVNRLFAEEVSKIAHPGATVWIHDYNLWMVPGLLRKDRHDLKIAFFHHTPFPSSDSFSIIPWRREILSSLIQCDYIGFHIPRYIENFVDALRGHGPLEILESESAAPRYLTHSCASGAVTEVKKVKSVESTVYLGAHPVGTDVKLIRDLINKPKNKQRIEKLRGEFSDKVTVLSVERLDYTKGPMEKLAAYEKFLEENPEWYEKLQFITIWTPPNPRMKVYRSIRSEVDEAIGRINGRFATYQWNPVRYFFQSFSYEDVLCFYTIADIAWVTPLRDGLNLVAKEYVATKDATNTEGVLILSEFAGASAELHGALLTNPYDISDMARVLKRAVQLKPETKVLHMERLFQIVNQYDIQTWAEDFLDSVKKATS